MLRDRTVIEIQSSPQSHGLREDDAGLTPSGLTPSVLTPRHNGGLTPSTAGHGIDEAGLVSPDVPEIEMKPREFFINRRHIPYPPRSAIPIVGLKMAPQPGYIDQAATPFSAIGVATTVLLLLAGLVFIVLPIVHVYMDDVSLGFRVGIPAGFGFVAIVFASTLTRTQAHFDRSTRTVHVAERRLLCGICCAARHEIPFRVIKGVRPHSSLGSSTTVELIVDTKKLREFENMDGSFDHFALNGATDHAASSSNSRPEDLEEKDDASDDEEDLVLNVAQVENAPDVIRSWRAYVTWLKNDAF